MDRCIIPKKRINRDKYDFATKQRMFGDFAIHKRLVVGPNMGFFEFV